MKLFHLFITPAPRLQFSRRFCLTKKTVMRTDALYAPATTRYEPRQLSETEIIAQFRLAIADAGLPVPQTIRIDDQWNRFSTLPGKPRDDAGYYRLHVQHPPFGVFGCWRSGIERHWMPDFGRPLTHDERFALNRDIARAKDQSERERQRRAADAAAKTAQLIESAQPPCPSHPYLHRKRLRNDLRGLFQIPLADVARMLGYPPQASGEPLQGDILILPITDKDGAYRGAELIDAHGRKAAIAGSQKSGNAYLPAPIPPNAPVIAIGEGAATVLTVAEVTGWPVVAALSAGNLLAVARQIRATHPNSQLIILADLEKKSGLAHPDAVRAAELAGARLATPTLDPASGTDWNDYALIYGHVTTRETLLAVLDTVTPPHPSLVAADALRGSLASANELPDPVARALELQAIAKAHSIGSRPDSLERFITAAERGNRRPFPAPPPDIHLLAAHRNEREHARLTPRTIVEGYLYADVGLLCGAGSSGKTTLLAWECIHIVTGRALYGMPVREPGPCLIVTAEDSRERLLARLRCVIEAMTPPLTDAELELVDSGIVVWDVSDQASRLVENDQSGEVMATGFADVIIEAARILSPVMVILDPLVSFHGAARLNDTEQAVILECRRLVRGLNACLRVVHHVSQNTARGGLMDQYAGRGGTALADGARMVHVLAPWNSNISKDTPPRTLASGANTSILRLARPKISYCPPQPVIWLARDGYQFTWATDAPAPAP